MKQPLFEVRSVNAVKFALTKSEYRSALRADHGTVRRYLAGCRCRLCDRPAHHRFARQLRRVA